MEANLKFGGKRLKIKNNEKFFRLGMTRRGNPKKSSRSLNEAYYDPRSQNGEKNAKGKIKYTKPGALRVVETWMKKYYQNPNTVPASPVPGSSKRKPSSSDAAGYAGGKKKKRDDDNELADKDNITAGEDARDARDSREGAGVEQ